MFEESTIGYFQLPGFLNLLPYVKRGKDKQQVKYQIKLGVLPERLAAGFVDFDMRLILPPGFIFFSLPFLPFPFDGFVIPPLIAGIRRPVAAMAHPSRPA